MCTSCSALPAPHTHSKPLFILDTVNRLVEPEETLCSPCLLLRLDKLYAEAKKAGWLGLRDDVDQLRRKLR